MNYESIRLGKIKKKAAVMLELGDDDPNAYVLPSDLDHLAAARPDDYLRVLEQWKDALTGASFLARKGARIEMYRILVEGGRFRVRTLLLERHEKWICKGFVPGMLVAEAKRIETI